MSNPAPVRAKICGLRTIGDVQIAVSAGASFIGFTHFPESPRHIELEAAERLASLLPEAVKSVSLLVDPCDEDITRVAGWTDYIQLHGHETPERAQEIVRLAGKPLIKAIPLATSADLGAAALYHDSAEILLFDAKTTKAEDLPGGNGVAFDWRILAGATLERPWMLSGGLTPENVGEAIRLTGARMVDVSSGVEETRGVKSPAKIEAFLRAVKEVSV